jgi:hypothetical protein
MSVPAWILPVMDTSHGATLAEQLASIPVVTGADVVARVDEIIEPGERRGRALWMFFFYQDGTQAPVIVPLDDMPEMPAEDDADVPFHMLRHFYGGAGEDLSFVLAICREGSLDLTASDRQWLRVLERGIEEYAAPVWMICLATPEGVRGVGPASRGRLPAGGGRRQAGGRGVEQHGGRQRQALVARPQDQRGREVPAGRGAPDDDLRGTALGQQRPGPGSARRPVSRSWACPTRSPSRRCAAR